MLYIQGWMEYNEFNLNKERKIMITIGEIKRVSTASRSKAAGRLVEVVGLRTNGMGRIKEVKVRIIPSFGRQDTQYAYVSPKFLETHVSAPSASTEPNVQFKWKLCRSVLVVKDHEFTIAAATDGTPWTTKQVAGFISDQWVEDGVKLYNIVFAGQFMVVPEFQIKKYCPASFA